MKGLPPLVLRWFIRYWVSVWESLSSSCVALWRPSASHTHPRENLPYTSRDASKFLAKWSLFFEERRWGIPHQGDTIPPFTVAWLWNFTGDGRNGGHSILLPPSDVTHQTEGEEERERDADQEWGGWRMRGKNELSLMEEWLSFSGWGWEQYFGG